jgi:hypothetical protein
MKNATEGTKARKIKQRKELVSSKTDYLKIQSWKGKEKRMKRSEECYETCFRIKRANMQAIWVQEGFENAKRVEGLIQRNNKKKLNKPREVHK